MVSIPPACHGHARVAPPLCPPTFHSCPSLSLVFRPWIRHGAHPSFLGCHVPVSLFLPCLRDGRVVQGGTSPSLPPLDRWESVGGRGQVGFRPRRLGVRTGTPSPFEPEGSAGSKGSCAGVGCPFRTKGPGRGSRRRNRWMRCCEAR